MSTPVNKCLCSSVINVEGLKRCRRESRPRLQRTDKYTPKTVGLCAIYINIRLLTRQNSDGTYHS